MRPALGAGYKWQIHFRGQLRLPVPAGVSTRALVPRHPEECEHENSMLPFLTAVACHVGLLLDALGHRRQKYIGTPGARRTLQKKVT